MLLVVRNYCLLMLVSISRVLSSRILSLTNWLLLAVVRVTRVRRLLTWVPVPASLCLTCVSLP